VNKSGSEELLYGLKSSSIGFWWLSSRIISNVSVDQRRSEKRQGAEMRAANKGDRAGGGRKRKRTITSTGIVTHYLIFEKRPQRLAYPLEDLRVLEVGIIIIIPHTSPY
jgi:hypothetical protein